MIENASEALHLYLDEPEKSKVIFSLPQSVAKGREKVKIAVNHKIAFAMMLRQERVKNHLTQNQVAEAIYQGATLVDGAKCSLIEIDETKTVPWDKINNADAIIFGSPTFMGNVAASFKGFMDKSGDFWLKQPGGPISRVMVTNQPSIVGLASHVRYG